MDYVKYYHDQANELSGFRGFAYQRGSGVGSILRKFFNYFAPAIKNTLIPTINKGLGFVKDEAISGLTNFTNDILENKNLKESAKTRFDESISNITSKLQKGSGKTKVKRLQKSCIFD
jgi:hypothetical protein